MVANRDLQIYSSMLPGRVRLLTLPTELHLQMLSFALLIDCGNECIANLDISWKF